MKLGKPNWKVITFSLIALICIALTFLVSPWFMIGAVILMTLNQIELMKKKK